MSFIRTCMAAALLCLPLALTATADEDRKLIDKTSADREPTNDKEFLIRAIANEVAEVKMAEKAEKSATNEDVRRMARTMAEEHRKILDDFKEQAKRMKLAVVEGLEKTHRELYDRLNKLEGAEFDREYMRIVVEGHEKVAKLYKKWAKDAKDADIRAATDKALEKMQDHLTHAKKLHDKLKG